jgi:FkbM family methyltransferase
VWYVTCRSAAAASLSKDRSCEVIHAGLWSRDTTLEIRDPPTGWRSWAFQTHEAWTTVANGIEGISIPKLLRRIGEDTIDVLKLDIEGTEKQIFSSGCLGWLARIGVVLVETHGDEAERVVGAALRRAAFAQLSAEGHRCVFVNPGFDARRQRREDRSSRAARVPP